MWTLCMDVHVQSTNRQALWRGDEWKRSFHITAAAPGFILENVSACRTLGTAVKQ